MSHPQLDKLVRSGELHRRGNTIESEGFVNIDKAMVEATLRIAAFVLEGLRRFGPVGGGS